MISRENLTDDELKRMREAAVDIDLSLSILQDYNAGKTGRDEPVIPKGVPPLDGKQVLDLRDPREFRFSSDQISQFKERFPLIAAGLDPQESGAGEGISLSAETLRALGTKLLGVYSYGFLNGGSATSYADRKKNQGFHAGLFRLYQEPFAEMAALSKGQPKGLTPAFLQPDGSPGPSYMELKLRSVLLCSKAASAKIPFFQMTSVSNNAVVQEALNAYRHSPWLQDLARQLDHPVWEGLTGIQPMITAYTHSSQGKSKDFFRGSDPDNPSFLALPGGHGQSFRVLKETFRELHRRGIRFISLGNIDNLGYTPDPLSLAILAVGGNPAGFDFSFKTAVDVKGGILITDQQDRLNCVDLGVGISQEEAAALEARGEKILFNCASGLFDLTWLLENIDRIIATLPLRFSDQNKDAGLYSQAEQVTWEVIGMIDNPLIFGVDKFKRFLAAKMLMENLLTSGLYLDRPNFPSSPEKGSLQETGRNLFEGLQDLLTRVYGLELRSQRWQPRETQSTPERKQ